MLSVCYLRVALLPLFFCHRTKIFCCPENSTTAGNERNEPEEYGIIYLIYVILLYSCVERSLSYGNNNEKNCI